MNETLRVLVDLRQAMQKVKQTQHPQSGVFAFSPADTFPQSQRPMVDAHSRCNC